MKTMGRKQKTRVKPFAIKRRLFVVTPKRVLLAVGVLAVFLLGGFGARYAFNMVVNSIMVSQDLAAFRIVPQFKQTTSPLIPAESPAPTQTTAAPVIKRQFGISLGDTLFGMPADKLNKQLDDMKSLGITWIRVDISWDEIQPSGPQAYSWANTDAIIQAANARKISVLPVLAYTPQWARSPGCGGAEKCAPANPQDFARFASQAVTRYSPQGVHAWEVWNEPNIEKFWQPTPNAASYTKLLLASYASIKRADPTAVVVSGGLSPAEDAGPNIAPRTYLNAMYKAGAKGAFDVFGMHPYSYPAPASTQYSWSAWSQMFENSPSVRSIMDANGDTAKAIWVTEYGAPTNGPGFGASITTYRVNQDAGHVDEDLQSYILQSAVTSLVQRDWSGVFFWYSYQDLGTDPDDNENFFGIIRADGTLKKSYSVLKQILATPQ
jgi:hypothetical protein